MQHHWALLGIAPTTDAVAIKRGYAQRLKQTRPDDDPHAYQQLREAYDWALAWARWQLEHAHAQDDEDEEEEREREGVAIVERRAAGEPAEDAPPEPPAHASALHAGPLAAGDDADATEPACDDGLAQGAPLHAPPPAAAPAAAAHDDTAQHDTPRHDAADAGWTAPEELARSLFAYWREAGDAALVAAWPRLHRELDRLPLSLRADASVWFAEFVLQNPGMPAALIARLAEYFDWGRDFRSDQQLGSARAHALEQRLLEAGAKPLRDQQLLRRYADLLNLHRLLGAGARWRAQLFAALANPVLGDTIASTSETHWNALKIDAARQAALRALAQQGMIVRAALCALLVGIVNAVVYGSGSADDVLRGFAVCGAQLACGLAAAWLGERLYDIGWAWLRGTLPRALTQDQRPRHGWLLAGIGAIAAAIAIAVDNGAMTAPEAGELAGFCAALLLLLAWPRTAAWRGLVPLLFSALCVAVSAAVPTMPGALAIGLAAVWIVLVLWLFERRAEQLIAFYQRPLRSFLPSTPLGWVWLVLFIQTIAAILAVLAILLAPLTLLVYAARRGTPFAVTALAGAFAAWTLSPDKQPATLLLLLLAAVPPAWLALQAGATRLSRLRALRAPEPR